MLNLIFKGVGWLSLMIKKIYKLKTKLSATAKFDTCVYLPNRWNYKEKLCKRAEHSNVAYNSDLSKIWPSCQFLRMKLNSIVFFLWVLHGNNRLRPFQTGPCLNNGLKDNFFCFDLISYNFEMFQFIWLPFL